MKKVFLAIVWWLIVTAAPAQFSASLRIGAIQKISSPFFSPALHFTAHNICFGAEMMVQTQRDEPANFGMHISYQIAFVEAGVGRYFRLYTTDEYDNYKNCWCTSPFIILHYQNWFLQYQYMQANSFSVGYKINIANLQN